MTQINMTDFSGERNLENVLKIFNTDTPILVLDHATIDYFTHSPLLDSFKDVTTLSAVNCGLRDLENLPGKETLEKLFLDDNELNDETLEPLAAFKKVRELSLAGNRFRYAEELLPLIKMWSLVKLNLANNPIVDDPDFDGGMRFLFRRRLLVDKGAETSETTIDESQASSSSHESERKTNPDNEPSMGSVEMADLLKKMEEEDSDYKPDTTGNSTTDEDDSIMVDASEQSLTVPNNTIVDE